MEAWYKVATSRKKAGLSCWSARRSLFLLDEKVYKRFTAALDKPGWSVTRAVEVARALDAALAGVDGEDAAWERVQKDVYASIQRLTEALLPYGYQPATTVEDTLFVVTVPFQGRDCTMSELREALGDEVTNRQLLLDAREREILENHLIGEVSAHLHERLRAAETLVREMNDELRTRRTSTGMILRFTWEPLDDGPPGLLEARTRLLRAVARGRPPSGRRWASSCRSASAPCGRRMTQERGRSTSHSPSITGRGTSSASSGSKTACGSA